MSEIGVRVMFKERLLLQLQDAILYSCQGDAILENSGERD